MQQRSGLNGLLKIVATPSEVIRACASDMSSAVSRATGGSATAGWFGGGSSVIALRNSNGVGIEVITTTKGVNLTVASGGVTLKIKK